MLCGHLLRYKKIVKKTYKFLDSKKSPETKVPGEIVISVMATIKDYSMIVATRPDPTVRPPSRYQTGVLRCANGGFPCDLWGKIRIFCFVRVVFGDFVIMVLSFSINNFPLTHPVYHLHHFSCLKL